MSEYIEVVRSLLILKALYLFSLSDRLLKLRMIKRLGELEGSFRETMQFNVNDY